MINNLNIKKLLLPAHAPVLFKQLKKLAKINPLIVNYHVVSDLRLPHIINLYNYRNIKKFSEDLDFYIKNFTPIGLPEFLDHVNNNTALPKNSLLLTFDDGFREIYDVVAPILLSKNLTATIFLTSNFVDNKELGYDNKKSLLIDYLQQPANLKTYKQVCPLLNLENSNLNKIKKAVLSIKYDERTLVDKIASEINLDFNAFLSEKRPYLISEQVQELIKKGITFGAHSIDHPRFAELPIEQQINQAKSSIQFVTDNFNLHYKVFAFPYSDIRLTSTFFEKISSFVEATFGTSGLLEDQIINNFQRISVEKYRFSAKKVVRFHFVKKIIYRKMNKDMIKRRKLLP